MSLTNNDDVILVSEWDSESFHRKVSELERRDTSHGGRATMSLQK
jgi:hypothetical protein